jgi:hypothetical protein
MSLSVPFCQKGDGESGDSQAAADLPDPLVGGGFHAYIRFLQAQGLGNAPTHASDVRGQARPLGDDGGVQVGHGVTLAGYHARRLGQQSGAVRPGVCRVIGREVLTDVAQARRPQKGIDNSMKEDIGIAVATQADLTRYLDAPQPQRAALLKSVNIIADAHTHV